MDEATLHNLQKKRRNRNERKREERKRQQQQQQQHQATSSPPPIERSQEDEHVAPDSDPAAVAEVLTANDTTTTTPTVTPLKAANSEQQDVKAQDALVLQAKINKILFSAGQEPKLPKFRKAIEKYMRRTSVTRAQLAASLEEKSVADSSFWSFAKKYFAHMSRDDFFDLARAAVDVPVSEQVQENERLETLKTSDLPTSAADIPVSEEVQENEQSGTFTASTQPVSSRTNPGNETTSTAAGIASRDDDFVSPIAAIPAQEAIVPDPSTPKVAHSTAVATMPEAVDDTTASPTEVSKQGPLSDTEEATIRDAVVSYCSSHDLSHEAFCNSLWDIPVPLQRVAKQEMYSHFLHLLPGRKPKGIKDWLRRAYVPYKRAPFSPEEDQAILRLRTQLGPDWKAIGDTLGRYKEDVRDRYRNHLDSKSELDGAWTLEETEKFQKILDGYNSKKEMNWAAIAKLMGTRSRPQCRDRYRNLQESLKRRLTVDQEVDPPPPPKAKRKLKVPEIDGRSGPKILPGDVVDLLKSIPPDARNLRDAAEKGAFSAFDGVFEMKQIITRLTSVLRDIPTARFAEMIQVATQQQEALGDAKLTRTLVIHQDELVAD